MEGEQLFYNMNNLTPDFSKSQPHIKLQMLKEMQLMQAIVLTTQTMGNKPEFGNSDWRNTKINVAVII